MIIVVDEKSIFIDEDELLGTVSNKIISGLDKEIKLPNGPTIDLTRKSLLSVCIRQIVSFIIPIVIWMANQAGVELPKKERHADVVKYIIQAYFLITKKVCSDAKISVTTKPYIDELFTIEKVELSKQNNELPFSLFSLFQK